MGESICRLLYAIRVTGISAGILSVKVRAIWFVIYGFAVGVGIIIQKTQPMPVQVRPKNHQVFYLW